ncbi:MAG: GNAT family N-acetyltransferase [Enterocloster asparagiformis]|nr:GNAT family N-acetyltransferase [Enterocloster asparagiformis]
MEQSTDKEYTIRFARPEDLEAVTQVEAECFPAAEAAGRESFRARLAAFPESFLVAERAEDGRIIGFINGAVTDARTISDDMFEHADLHNPNGAYQSIFGLDVIGEFRCRGVAAALMNRMIETARERGKKGLILTCKDRLIHYYQRFGYVNLGVSASVHGGAVWYDMLLEF